MCNQRPYKYNYRPLDCKIDELTQNKAMCPIRGSSWPDRTTCQFVYWREKKIVCLRSDPSIWTSALHSIFCRHQSSKFWEHSQLSAHELNHRLESYKTYKVLHVLLCQHKTVPFLQRLLEFVRRKLRSIVGNHFRWETLPTKWWRVMWLTHVTVGLARPFWANSTAHEAAVGTYISLVPLISKINNISC